MMENVNTLVHGGANCEPKRLVFKVVETEPCGMGEVFQVEDLLDFSDDEIGGPIFNDCIATLSAHANESSSVTELESSSAEWVEKICTRAPNVDQSGQAFGELCVPSDELANQLEWLSNFVEDSYPAHDEALSPLFGLGNSTTNNKSTADSSDTTYTFESRSPVSVLEEGNIIVSSFRASRFSSNMYIPGRRRSKRSRTEGRVWSLHTLMSPSPEAHTGTPARHIIAANETQIPSLEQESTDSSGPSKRANKGKKSSETSPPRKCSHCQVQKTPQWRAGPMGPKTLCNACGVRYKSGRLMPEYRPAGSPSFVSEIHSNSHKKILEMRRNKEQEISVQCNNQQPEQQQLWGTQAEGECDEAGRESSIHVCAKEEDDGHGRGGCSCR